MAQTINKFLIPSAPAVDLSYLPSKLSQKLLPFQKEGIYFAVQNNGRCLIGDEMGLGKTLQAIAVACYYREEWPLLILLPASLKYQWVEELEKWLPELLPTDINMINNSSDVGNINKCKINIVAYSILRYGNPNTSVLLKAIKAQKFKVLICDESHNIKNKKTRTANVVVDLVKNSLRCLLLSGTPALNKPVELYTQIDAILPGRFGTFNDYTIRYCNARYVYYGRSKVWNVDGAKNLDELELKLKQHLMIRRLKKDVLKQLPPKRRQKVPFDLKFDSDSAVLQKELAAMQEELEHLLSSAGASMAQVIQPSQAPAAIPGLFDIRKLISQLYVKTCEAKVGPVVEFVLFYTGGDNGNKVLVFAHHYAMLDSIQKAMWDANIKHIRIDGSVPSSERNLLVKQFQSDASIRVAILSILAAGSGLTLTAASVVVFAELYWTPAILMQCEDRAHRIGQLAQSVNIYYLVARGTIDERVWSMVEKKTRVLALALDGQKKGLSAIDSNKHVSDILSSAQLQPKSAQDDSVQVDINVEDFFALADLKCQNQPLLKDFLTPGAEPRPTCRKRQKKLVLKPAEVTVLCDSDGEEVPQVKTPRLGDQELTSWALSPKSVTTEVSLPSLTSSPDHQLDSPARPESPPPCPSPHHHLDHPTPPKSSPPCLSARTSTSPNKCDTSHATPITQKESSITEERAYNTDEVGYTRIKDPSTIDCSQKDLDGLANKDIDLVASFDIIPNRKTSGSDSFGDLFSDASFEDEIINDSAEDVTMPPTQTLSAAEKTEEAQLAEELFGEEIIADDEDAEYWICQCTTVNDRELDCCSKCALPRLPTTWMCHKCHTVNKMADDVCDECLTEKDEMNEGGEEERVVDLDKVPTYNKFFYLVSHHTHRIFLHDEAKNYLHSSFHAVDLDNPDLLPDILLKRHNFELAKEFVSKWNCLKKREQKALVKKRELVDCPEQAYFGGKLTRIRNASKQRYKQKADVAADAAKHCENNPGAQTRHIVKHSTDLMQSDSHSSNNAGYIQVMAAGNKPLCIHCHSVYESDLLSTSVLGDEKNAWQTRFCSPQCADEFWLSTHNKYIRDTAKSLDAGVCEQCGLDCNQLFRRIKCSRSLKERAELLQNTRYSSLSTSTKVNMVKEPSEGQFWHVDHILPVYAGGGQCGVENLRTLCTPCHQTVTAAQAGHRARMRASLGNHSISDFFSPASKSKLKAYD